MKTEGAKYFDRITNAQINARRDQRRARGHKLGALSKGKRKPTQAEKDEIAAYLARNPIPYGEST